MQTRWVAVHSLYRHGRSSAQCCSLRHVAAATTPSSLGPTYTPTHSPTTRKAMRSALIAQRMCSLHYVQRLLRRLPSAAHTSTLLYLNELPANMQAGLIRLALYKRHESNTTQEHDAADKTTTNKVTSADALRRLLLLRGPRATIAENKVKNYLRSLPRSHRTQHSGTLGTQSPTLMLPQTEAQYAALGLAISSTSVSGCNGSSSSSSVQLCSESGADRVDYRDSPVVYLLVVPSAELSEKHVSVTTWLQRSMVYDETTQQLLRKQFNPECDSTGQDNISNSEDVFFAQGYHFDPHAALALAQQLNSRNGKQRSATEDKERQKGSVTSYRVFYLIACKDEQTVDARWPSAHSTTHSHAEERAHGVSLCDVASLFPSCFTSTTVELNTRTMNNTSNVEPCAPMRLKKLCYERSEQQRRQQQLRGNESDAANEVSLWSTQLEQSGLCEDEHHDLISNAYSLHGKGDASSIDDDVSTTVPLHKEDMQYLKRILTRAKEDALRATRTSEPYATRQNVNEDDDDDVRSNADAMSHSVVEPVLDERCVRQRRMPFTVVEVTPHTTHTTLSSSKVPPCALLAPTLWRLLYTMPQTTTSSVSSSSSCRDVVPTALDDLITARERLLLPFLRRPRQLPRRFFHSTTNVTSDKLVVGDFVPVLWSLTELEQLLGWYTMRHVFADRYGPLRNLLSPDLYVSIGDGEMIESEQEKESVDVVEGSSSCFVLVQDLTFVQRVLLPAMHRYSSVHRLDFAAHTTSGNTNMNAVTLDKAVRRAIEVHQTRLADWLQLLQEANDVQLQSWLRLSSHTSSSTTSVSRMPAPRQSRAFFVGGEEGSDVTRVRHRLQQRFAIVPIVPFLNWATQPSLQQHKEESSNAVSVFSPADVVRCLQYFLTYPPYFELIGGDGTTVAIAIPE